MKKLMIAAAIVCAAAFSQAATISWQLSMGQSIYLPGSTTDKLTSGTAYLFDTAKMTQATLLADFLGSGIDTSKSLANTGVTGSGGLTTKAITSGFTEEAYSTYFYAIVDGKNLFISDAKADFQNPAGDKTTTLQMMAKTASQKDLNKTGEYAGGGWYTAVPEPTSGLLLLLGVAGLALRRRRA